MSKQSKFTFKKHPKHTGLYAVGHPYSSVDIKLNKKKVGQINAPNGYDKRWQVGFTVVKKDIMEDGNPNCSWKWVFVESCLATEEAARQYIKDNTEELLKLPLYSWEDD